METPFYVGGYGFFVPVTLTDAPISGSPPVSHTVPETISAATHNGNMAAAAVMYVATILFTLFIVFGE